MIEQVRTAQDIWNDLEKLCISPGYMYTLIKLSLDTDYDQGQLSNYNLITHSELSLVLGIMIKNKLNIKFPTEDEFKHYEQETKKLLKEYQDAISRGLTITQGNNQMDIQSFFQEACFYSKQSALNFQYLEFAIQRYKNDAKWLQENRGFTVDDIQTVQNSIINILLKNDSHSLFFTFTELIENIGLEEKTVQNVINNFAIEPKLWCNSNFKEIGDYNIADSHPIISLGNGKYCIFFTLFCKSIYQSPRFWMIEDKGYEETANKNRGEFTENFITNKLTSVFGQKNIYKNVKISNSENKSKIVGEIDVLVFYAGRALVIQAKSKSLTLKSRKGCKLSLEKDFQDSIQTAYNQGKTCAEKLSDAESYRFFDSDNTELYITNNIQDINIMCVVSDDYSALPMHIEQFLEYDNKYPPYIVDVFILDLIVTFLNEPLYFLNFIYYRTHTQYFQEVIPFSLSEFDVLYKYLKCGLSEAKEEQYDKVIIGEDRMSSTLDNMMIEQYRKPSRTIEAIMAELKFEGMRTLFLGTFLEKTIDYINKSENDLALDFGFFLLDWDKALINLVKNDITIAMEKSVDNKKNYTLCLIYNNIGLDICCNYNPTDKEYIYHYCNQAKYRWFGEKKPI